MKVTTTFLLAGAALAVVGVAACGASNPVAAPSRSSVGASGSTGSGGSLPTPSGSAATESNPPGDIPDTQAYVDFAPPGGPVTLKVPEGWAKSSTASSTTFTDKLNRIEVRLSTTGSAPTPSSLTTADVPTLQKAVPSFSQPKVTSDNRTAGPVLVLTYQGDSSIDPVTGKVVRDAFEQYTFYRNGSRVDLTLSGPVNADNVDPWRMVSDSLRWTR